MRPFYHFRKTLVCWGPELIAHLAHRSTAKTFVNRRAPGMAVLTKKKEAPDDSPTPERNEKRNELELNPCAKLNRKWNAHWRTKAWAKERDWLQERAA